MATRTRHIITVLVILIAFTAFVLGVEDAGIIGTYIILGTVGAFAFLVFAAGRVVGGFLDDAKPDADGKLPPLPDDAGYIATLGRWINTGGDKVQIGMATLLIAVSLIALAISGVRWNMFGKDEMIFVLAAVTASFMIFYLSADKDEKKARGIQVNWLITATWVGFILINVFVANNAEWFRVQIKEITVAERKELVIPTPTGTILSVPEILGPAWETYLKEEAGPINDGARGFYRELQPNLALNLATGGFDLRWNEEEKKYEMRSTRVLPRWGFARGEYAQAEDIRLTQKADRLDVKEVDIVQSKREARLEAGKLPFTSRLPVKSIGFALILILVGLGILAVFHEEKKPEEKKDDKKPTDPKAAAPKAA